MFVAIGADAQFPRAPACTVVVPLIVPIFQPMLLRKDVDSLDMFTLGVLEETATFGTGGCRGFEGNGGEEVGAVVWRTVSSGLENDVLVHGDSQVVRF